MSTANIDHPNPTEAQGRGRLVLFLIIPALLIAAGLVTFFSRARSSKALAAEATKAAAEPVSVLHAAPGSPSNELVLPATLQPYDDSPVYARVSGYVSHWYTDIGQHVHQGQLLAVIDAPEIDQQLVQARAALNQSKANLALADVTARRYSDLIKSNSVSQQDVDQSTQNLSVQRAGLESATAQVANLAQQQAYEKVIAPFDGVITQRLTDIGDLINAGNNGMGAQLFQVSRIGIMRIFVSVPEAASEQVKVGMHVKIELTALPGQMFDGQVTRTDDAINTASRTLLVEVDVPNRAGKLMPGAYAQVHFTIATAQRPLMIPTSSIIFQAAGPQVAVVDSAGKIRLRKVVLGRDFGNTIEISNGITEQDQVVANPPDYLVDGMTAAVQKVSGTKAS